MTHELHQLLKAHLSYHEHNHKVVLVTLVSLNGSSYRKPGVRMMITESGQMIGAVSGGCVEKEIKLQAQEVFQTNKPKMMTYDGRYRLGCEGILHLLIEPMALNLEETKAIIDHTRTTDNSVEYRFDNGYILELYRFDDLSTGLPIHASTSITLYSQSGEIMTEHVYIH